MSRCQQVARPMARCLRQGLLAQHQSPSISSTGTLRLFSSSASRRDVEPTRTTASTPSTEPPPAAPAPQGADIATKEPNSLKAQWLDPNTTTLIWAEKKLIKEGTRLIGSRRRRAAVRQTSDLPFEQLPYHCFQEARKVLAEDRAEKLELIKAEVKKLRATEAKPARQYKGGQAFKEKRLKSLRKYIEYLKIQADINDPAVRRKWEDGMGDMTKPIYRHFSEEKWRGMAYKILVQRLEQFHIVPDVLPKFDPQMDIQLTFHGIRAQPGEIVDSLLSENPPNIRTQIFDSKQRLVSVIVMDSDVPDPEKDAFGSRLHFMAANIPINSVTKNISLQQLARSKIHSAEKIAVPWLPPFSQEGAPYHRLSVWIMEQEDNKPLDIERLRKLYSGREGFHLSSFRAGTKARPFGFNIFRAVWDEHTKQVMERHGIPGSEIVFRRQRVRSLKPPKKKRGWEAKRQGPKYRQLWKYSKRIAPMSGGT